MRRFGSYRVTAELGSGGVASLHRAVHESLGREVVIKALKSTVPVTSPFAAPIEREARLLAEVHHPGIVTLFDFVREADTMYMVLEYVDGFRVADLVLKKVPFAAESVAALGVYALRALGYAHARGIIHRDIKPANLLLSKDGDLKIIDFGIAQRERLPTADEPLALDPPSDAFGAFGTAAYMSPEQVLGEPVDARSDLFSLAVVLYELLAAGRPFDHGEGARGRTRRDPVVPLRERAPEVPHRLERILMRALEKAPMDRFDSADMMAAELEDFLRGEGASASAKLVRRMLGRARLIASDSDEGALSTSAPVGTPVRRAALGFATLGTLAIIGGGLIQLPQPGQAAPLAAAPVELSPQKTGYLRVLVTPWADVSVDGALIDTTPFARSIPLMPGTHYVTLVHPNAPPERRVVKVGPGTTQLLDVTMNLTAAAEVRDAG